MQIQPISIYSTDCRKNIVSNQTNFKGIKGFLKGGAIGAGATAAGVTLIAGAAALPLFLGYIALNGVITGATGHIIESKNKDK